MECERGDWSDSLAEESDVVFDGVERRAAVVEDLDEGLRTAARADRRVIVNGEGRQNARLVLVG